MYVVRESGDEVSGRGDSAALSSVDGLMISVVLAFQSAARRLQIDACSGSRAFNYLQNLISKYDLTGSKDKVVRFLFSSENATIFFEFIRLFVHNSACREH